MNPNSKVFVAGHKGLVGSAIVRNLKQKGYNNISSSPSDHWDLRKRDDVDTFLGYTILSMYSLLLLKWVVFMLTAPILRNSSMII